MNINSEYEVRPVINGHGKEVYYALVRSVNRLWPYWEFCDHHRPYRTANAAEKAVARHLRVWDRFVRLSRKRGNRVKRLQSLVKRNPRIFQKLPLWVVRSVNIDFLRLQFPWVDKALWERYNG